MGGKDEDETGKAKTKNHARHNVTKRPKGGRGCVFSRSKEAVSGLHLGHDSWQVFSRVEVDDDIFVAGPVLRRRGPVLEPAPGAPGALVGAADTPVVDTVAAAAHAVLLAGAAEARIEAADRNQAWLPRKAVVCHVVDGSQSQGSRL